MKTASTLVVYDAHWISLTGLPCIVAFGLGFASLSLLTPSLMHFYLVFILLGLMGI
jgi:hypothetical protein